MSLPYKNVAVIFSVCSSPHKEVYASFIGLVNLSDIYIYNIYVCISIYILYICMYFYIVMHMHLLYREIDAYVFSILLSIYIFSKCTDTYMSMYFLYYFCNIIYI